MAFTSGTLMPKMKRFSSPASSAISTLAPSMVPMVSAPFSMNFMLPVPEASSDAVVLQVDDLEEVAHQGVVIDDVSDGCDQLDDQLGGVVTGSRLRTARTSS
ncbi:hypothetical protein EYF80_058538 [Liparis tanakae]|uniref:Uncharacterized protein n=1 Tax=Liparis tanakae TaxID=230148 RepID=A0A4Z2ERT0_9TELE|nr:hypothetical protein EYF80_058538 [Liparis tanakae]